MSEEQGTYLEEQFELADERKPGWWWAYNSIIDDHAAALGPHAFTVYCFLARHANSQGQSWYSISRIADQLDMSPTTVKSAIRHLETRGLVHTQHRTNASGVPTSNLYTLTNADKRTGQQVTNSRKPTRDPAADDQGIRQQTTHTRQQVSTKDDSVRDDSVRDRGPATKPAEKSELTEAKSLWMSALSELELCVTPPTFNTWLLPTRAVTMRGPDLVLKARDQYAAVWINERLRTEITRALTRAAGHSINYQVVL